MIEIKNISKEYKKNKKVINDINLEIKDGEIFGFLGPNGAGKTTTIKMITGILEIDKGDILIDGKSIKKEPIEAKKQIGLVPDNPDVFLKLKGIEYLNFMADIYEVSTQDRVKRIKELSEKFEINNVLNNKIESYSHGMRQKLIIIGVLLHNPKNWILDEPMTGLDPKSSFELKNMMREHANQKNTVFFSTHILDVAERLCDRIGIIDKGKLLFVGTYEDLKKELKENIVIITGFQGIDENNNITTLGRGGSDTTAVALSAELNASRCYIYSDVDGIYTADPRKIPNADKLTKISYEEMYSLSSEGAKVLHDRCVEIGEKFDVPIITESTFNDKKGTEITHNLESSGVKSIVKKEISKISVIGYGISSNDDILQKVLEIANENKLEIFNIEITRTKISIIFKEIVDDNILKQIHDVLI